MFFISVIISPFAFKKEIKGIRAAALVMLLLVVAFSGCLIAYFFQNYWSLRASHPSSNFSISVLPTHSIYDIVPKISILLNAAAFN